MNVKTNSKWANRLRAVRLLLVVLLLLPAARAWAESAASGTSEIERNSSAAVDPLVVAVSVEPLGYWIKRLLGEQSGSVEVVTIVPRAAAPELFELSLGARRKLEQAELLWLVGHPAIPFEKSVINSAAEHSKVLLLEDSRTLKLRDPHLWLSLNTIEQGLPKVAKALEELRPDLATTISANLPELLAEIAEARSQLAKRLADLKNRAFLTYHPVYGPFAEEFGLTQLAIDREGSEASSASYLNAITTASAEGCKTLFSQPQFSSSKVELIAKRHDFKVVTLDPLQPETIAMLSELVEIIESEDSADSRSNKEL